MDLLDHDFDYWKCAPISGRRGGEDGWDEEGEEDG